MAKKKDSTYFSRKVETLRSLGIDAKPITELVVVGVDYNTNQLKALAESKGKTEEELLDEFDKVEKGTDEIVQPAEKLVHSRELRKNKGFGGASDEEIQAALEAGHKVGGLSEEVDEEEPTDEVDDHEPDENHEDPNHD